MLFSWALMRKKAKYLKKANKIPKIAATWRMQKMNIRLIRLAWFSAPSALTLPIFSESLSFTLPIYSVIWLSNRFSVLAMAIPTSQFLTQAVFELFLDQFQPLCLLVGLGLIDQSDKAVHRFITRLVLERFSTVIIGMPGLPIFYH